MTDLEIIEQRAVDAAINQKWREAIALNKKIITTDKKNLRSYLRLGFAYIQTGHLEDAKKSYKKALKLQPSSQLAQDNLERIKILASRGNKKKIKKELKLDPNLFLDLPGKTKSVALVKLGQKNILAQLIIGQEAYLKPKKRKIEIRTKSGEYIGSLPDDLSRTLFIFIKGGNLYSAFIKEVSLSRVVVFIKEDKKSKRFIKYASFPKNIQGDIAKLSSEEDLPEAPEDDEDIVKSELENLAENLTTHDDKEYLPYPNEVEDEDNLEE